jgi:predicted 2-oxoglutarate/Fe(II)-dependent dioxygenase YbiX
MGVRHIFAGLIHTGLVFLRSARIFANAKNKPNKRTLSPLTIAVRILMSISLEAKPPLLLQHKGPVADFNPGGEDNCFCGSGKPFNSCCGSTQAVRPPPVGLFMFEDYLDRAFTRELVAFAERRPGERLMVIDDKASTLDNIVEMADERRVTERVDLGERRQDIIHRVKTIFTDLAAKCFGQSLDWIETPELMRYQTGGFYIRHADSENMNPETQTWSKVIDRDISLLIYLNDDFEGGELSFYKFNYQIRPRAGAVVLFPSDHRYLHQAEIVTKGVRYAIVSWASVHGMPKIASQPSKAAIFLD